MVLWITVYSFFDTPNFNDEVVVLFGEISFWATVLFSVVVALGKQRMRKIQPLMCSCWPYSPEIRSQVPQERIYASRQGHCS